RYLARLDKTGAAAPAGLPSEPQAAFAALHHFLAGEHADSANPAWGSVQARLRLFLGRSAPLAPPIARASMVPHPWGILDPLARRIQYMRRRRRLEQERRAAGAARQPWPANAPEDASEDVVDGP